MTKTVRTAKNIKKTVLIFGLVFILGIAVAVAGIFGFGPEGILSIEEIVDPNVDTVDSTVVMELTIGELTDTVVLTGPTTIKRGEPIGDGDDMIIPIEIVSMQLTGVSPVFGPVILRNPNPDDLITPPGSVNKGNASTKKDFNGEPQFPADSFFDVFFVIEIEPEPEVRNRYFYGKLMRVEGPIDGWPPPDNTHTKTDEEPTPINDTENQQVVVGNINFFTWTPHPTPQKKLAKIVIKVLNKIVNSMQLGATKSFNVTVLGRRVVAVGGVVGEGNITILNPYSRDSNIKICVDASRMNGRVELKLDVAGDGDYSTYDIVTGPRLRLLRFTCFETAAREFQLILTNTGIQPADVEVAIIWSTGSKKV